ncbi:MAG: hypothetical protein ABR976_18880 [Terracidiphilus sp.]|jgi:hypothetical protein
MKLGRATISGASVALVVIQLALVSSIAAKYLYQRWRCPRVWTRTVAYDPELLMRGRYLSVQLVVDGCQSTLPSAKEAQMPRDVNGVQTGTQFSINAPAQFSFPAELKVEGNTLKAVRLAESKDQSAGQWVMASPGWSCANLRLQQPVDFYISEHAASPVPVKAGQELWIEVTVPPKGPPRPVQLALKENGNWRPLAFQ